MGKCLKTLGKCKKFLCNRYMEVNSISIRFHDTSSSIISTINGTMKSMRLDNKLSISGTFIKKKKPVIEKEKTTEYSDSGTNFTPSMDDNVLGTGIDVTDALKRSVAVVDKYYKMNHPRRGKVIIFNHFRFTNNYPERKGTASDVKNLMETLPKLGFRTEDIDIHDDLVAAELYDELQKVRKEDHSDTDLLMVFVLTHGAENDKICASDVEYSVESLWEPFRADKCPTLAGKPKIFFVVACRGQDVDKGLIYEDGCVTEVDAKPMKYYSYPIPVWSDFLYVFSTYKGYVSYRNTGHGTWYIQAFCKELSTTDISRISFTEFLTAVNGRLLQFEPGRQTPTFSSTLTKTLYFTEKKVQI